MNDLEYSIKELLKKYTVGEILDILGFFLNGVKSEYYEEGGEKGEK